MSFAEMKYYTSSSVGRGSALLPLEEPELSGSLSFHFHAPLSLWLLPVLSFLSPVSATSLRDSLIRKSSIAPRDCEHLKGGRLFQEDGLARPVAPREGSDL